MDRDLQFLKDLDDDKQELILDTIKEQVYANIKKEIEKLVEEKISNMFNSDKDTGEIKKGGEQLNIFKDLKVEYSPFGSNYDFVVKDVFGNEHWVDIKASTNENIKLNRGNRPVRHFRPNEDISIPDTNENHDFSDWVLISNVKQILDESGLKQSWLQQKTQIPQSTLWSILNNEKAVSLENAMKISIVMEMPINVLFSYISLSDATYENENS